MTTTTLDAPQSAHTAPDAASSRSSEPIARARLTTKPRDRVIRGLPLAAVASLLGLTLVHLTLASVLFDQRHDLWITLVPEVTPYHLWSTDGHQRLGHAAAGALALGLTLLLAARRFSALRIPARITCALAAGAALALPLSQPKLWELGLGLPAWTWALPLRIALLAVAAATLALLLRPAVDWPRWLLTGGLLAVAALMSVPQSTRAHRPVALLVYCDLYGPRCHTPTESCQGLGTLPAEGRVVPVERVLDSLPLRARARQRLDERLALRGGPEAPKGWTIAAQRPGTWKGSPPWKQQRRMLSNGWLHLVLQEARLLGLGLLLVLGLPLGVWLLIRRHRAPHPGLLALISLLALLVAASGLTQWSNLSVAGHAPFALILPVSLIALVALLPGPRRARDSVR